MLCTDHITAHKICSHIVTRLGRIQNKTDVTLAIILRTRRPKWSCITRRQAVSCRIRQVRVFSSGRLNIELVTCNYESLIVFVYTLNDHKSHFRASSSACGHMCFIIFQPAEESNTYHKGKNFHVKSFVLMILVWLSCLTAAVCSFVAVRMMLFLANQCMLIPTN